MDRASGFEPEGWEFESLRARHPYRGATSVARGIDVKVVLITGAAGGLGWALARVLFARGDALGRTDVNATLLAEREQALGDPARVLAVAGDITGDAFRRALLAQARERFGRLDTLVNNAGITHRSLVARTDPAVFDKVMAVDW